MKKHRFIEHLDNTVKLAKRDQEWAKQQTEVLLQYVLEEVIENFNPPSCTEDCFVCRDQGLTYKREGGHVIVGESRPLDPNATFNPQI